MTDSKFFVAGTIGGMAGVVAGQPLDTLKVRMQTSARFVERFFPFTRELVTPRLSVIAAETWAEEGVRGFYRGMSSPMLGVALQKSCAFGAYGMALSALQSQPVFTEVNERGDGTQLKLPSVFLAGMAGGVANTMILTAVDQLKICLQVEPAGAAEATTLRDAARSFVAGGHFGAGAVSPAQSAARALRALYTAWPATLARELPGYGLYFTVYEALSRWRRKHDAQWAIPFVGGVAGVVMWGMYYPLDIVKSRTMAEVAGCASELAAGSKNETARALRKNLRWSVIARNLYAEQGLRGFYVGWLPAVLRAFPTHAAVFAMYEAVMSSTAYIADQLDEN